MTLSLKKSLKNILPIALGVFLVWYLYNSTTAEQRTEILDYIKGADPLYIGISIAIGILSHVSRAIRWNYLLQPLGYKPRTINNVLIILTAYLTNLGIPRSGEFLRATALATYEDVPFEKGFGTIVTERLVDVLMLLLIILVALFLQTDLIFGFIRDTGIGLFGGMIFLLISILGLIIAVRLIKKSKSGIVIKIRGFLTGWRSKYI